MKASNRFENYAIIGASSEDPDYPSGSLKVYDSSTESFRTLTAGTLTITLDLGSPAAAPTVLLYRTNFGTVRFHGNASDDWGSPAWSSGDFTIEPDPDHFIRKRGILLEGFEYRYLRVEVPAQTPDPRPGLASPASFFEIGALAIITELEDFGVYAGGFRAPDMEHIPAETVITFETNRKDIIPLSALPVLGILLEGTMLNSQENREKTNRVFRDPLRSLVYVDRSGEGNSWQVYLAQRTGAMRTSEPVPGNDGVRNYSITLETIL